MHIDFKKNSSYNTHIAKANPFRYRGYYFDTETGLYYLNSRYYDPATRRFINADDPSIPVLEQATDIGGLNLYSYCLNNPVNCFDPTGRFVLNVFLVCLIAGAAIGGILGGVTAAQKGVDILTGVLTGILLGGAVGAVAGLGGAYLAGGLSGVAGKLISDTASNIIFGTNNFGSWEDYAIAFVFGGLLKGAPLGNSAVKVDMVKRMGDIVIRPLANQLVKMGTRGATFDDENYMYTIVCRSVTYDFGIGKLTTPMFGSDFSINLSKSISRGFLSGFRKKYMI